MPWDHEPTPNPSQEGNGEDADEYQLPSWEGSGVGRLRQKDDDLSFFLSPSLAGLCLDFAHDAEPNRFHHRHGHRGGQDGTDHGAHLLSARSWPEGGGAQT